MPGRLRDGDGAGNSASSKKPRYEPSKGAILKIKVHNFMTYADAEICPGPRLNLVLGPNGTGKSSLVNAICLGLAGATQLLGRADNVRDFVRRGESEGFVQIWLSTGRSEPIVIKRSLKAAENASEWRINGAPSNLTKVKEKVRELNVQLDNLCQFLPQDKVVEFAKLKPGQLLEETEKAIGDSTLFTLHQELIRERNELRVFETAADASKSELDLLRKTNEGLQRDVKRFEQKEQLEEEVRVLKDKLKWMAVWKLEKEHQESQGKYEAHQEQLVRMNEGLARLTEPRREKEERQSKAAREQKRLHDRLNRAETEAGDLAAKLDEKIEEAVAKLESLETLEQDQADHEARLAGLRAEIDKLRADLAELATQQSQAQAPDHTAEIQQLNREKRDAMTTVHGLECSRDELQSELQSCQQEAMEYRETQRRLSNVKVQRLRQLETSNPGISELVRWLDVPENKSRFRGQVFGPILCEISVDNPQNAAYLEQHCPRDLWLRFVTEFQEDQDLLSAEARHRFNFRPTVTNFNGNVDEPIRHRLGDASQFAMYGIINTLDEVFQAPQTVRLVMCNEANLHETYIGNSRLDAERFLSQNRSVQRLLTPDSQYMVRTSRYNSSARSSSVSAMRPANLLAVGANQVQNEAESAALQAKLREAQARETELKGRLAGMERDIRGERERSQGIDNSIKRLTDAANASRNKRARLQGNLKTKERQLATAEKRADPRSMEPAIRAEIDTLNADICAKITKHTEDYKALIDWHKKHIIATATASELKSQVEKLLAASREETKSLRSFERLVEQEGRHLEEEKQRLRRLKKDAVDSTGPMTQDLKAIFEALPAEKEAVESAVEQKEITIDNIQLANPRAMAEFNKRRAEIEKLAAATRDQQEDVEVRRAAIDAKKAQWLPELKRIMEEVNANFGASFARIGCAGEVRLHEDPGQDFEQYAIHINVRFRPEEGMQLLTAHRQSGGERSVSTILYLIAIQGVTACPFRVVDEINQGMDPVNERKVFLQLVEAACRPGTPQCFLLTPKLLPDLPFSQHVTIMNIMNGPQIADVARGFKLDDLLGGRKEVATAA